MKYAAIADWAEEKEYSVTFMCEQLGVVRQGYYRWRSAGPCERERTDAELTEVICEIHTELHGHPGVRRVWAELVTRGAGGAQAHLATDAGRWPAWTPAASLAQDHHRRSAVRRCAGSDRAGLHRRDGQPPLVRRHYLCAHR